MQTELIKMPADQAYDLYRQYIREKRKLTPMDVEIKRAYRAISQGKTIIKAIESVARAGLKADTFPQLALVRADAPRCHVSMGEKGGATFTATARNGRALGRAAANSIIVPPGSFRNRLWASDKMSAAAAVPQVPLHLRPATNLHLYTILWEAEWTPVPPVDPMLLRRIGEADMWVVCAHWNLTEVERAALATRI